MCWLTAALAGAGCSAAAPPPTLSPPAAPLTASGADLGVVWEQPSYLHRVMLSNDGDEPLAVERVQGNCQCTAARVLEKVIPAHGQVAGCASRKLVGN
jgi:hypothetical protein